MLDFFFITPSFFPYLYDKDKLSPLWPMPRLPQKRIPLLLLSPLPKALRKAPVLLPFFISQILLTLTNVAKGEDAADPRRQE